MSVSAISIENLGKKYRLRRHQEAHNYVALRDVIADAAKGAVQRIRSLFKPIDAKSRSDSDSTHVDFWALRDISVEFNPGEAVGIIGRNGAGKSTLLKILSRITEQTVGRIRIRGRVASLLEVGTGFHPELTGRENVFLNGAILGMSKVELRKKFHDIVAFAEVEKFIDTPVKRYSSGMRMRLAFAVAAHLEPEILLVDEVLAVGDAEFQRKCLNRLGEGSKKGQTVLFVSHNLAAVRTLCSRACWLENGRVAADGPAHQVVDSYLSGVASAEGVVQWSLPSEAPGDDFVRLRSVTVSCEGMASGQVDIKKDFKVTAEYWVLKECSRLILSFHLTNERGETVVCSSNMVSVTATYDRWAESNYPVGVYRTSCVYPGCLFNDGIYRVTVFVNDYSVDRNHVVERDVLGFEIVDTGFMREEFQGPWSGTLRIKLPWSTEQMAETCSDR